MPIEAEQLPAWIAGEQPLERAQITLAGVVQSRLRLLYQQWPSNPSVKGIKGVAGSNCLPMAEKTFGMMTKALGLPRCYLYDFASRECVPLRVKRRTKEQSVGRYRRTWFTCSEEY